MKISHRRRADDLFRTRIPLQRAQSLMDWTQPVLSLGSCFAEEIGNRLLLAGQPVMLNPLGVLYNPLSLSRLLERILNNERFTAEDLMQHSDLWLCTQAHSRFSHPDQGRCLALLNGALDAATEWLPQSGVMLLSLGTAWAYEEKESGQIVCNCHRLPGDRFVRRRLGVVEIVDKLKPLLLKLLKVNPKLQILLSVSPVRHLRDTPVENTRSKSILHLATEDCCTADGRLHYFPAWEILMDELRDYRYYADDLAHPAPIAVEYLFRRFAETWITDEGLRAIEEITAIRTALEHRPRHPAAGEYRRFLDHLGKRIQSAQSNWPGILVHELEQKRQSLLLLHLDERGQNNGDIT